VQEVFVVPADTVLHQCIRSLLGAVLLRAIMDISAHPISLGDRPQPGPFGSPVLACAGKTDPPSSSHPLANLGGGRLTYVIDELLISCFALFLTMWNEFLPISMPITAIAQLDFSDMACSLSSLPPSQLLLLAGAGARPDHPIKRHFACFSYSTPKLRALWKRASVRALDLTSFFRNR
jgi:hypothetical protein